MEIKFTALADISHELLPDIQLESKLKAHLRREISNSIKPLSKFGIEPIKGSRIERSDLNVSDLYPEGFTAFRLIQKVTGHWLQFLHARREGLFSSPLIGKRRRFSTLKKHSQLLNDMS